MPPKITVTADEVEEFDSPPVVEPTPEDESIPPKADETLLSSALPLPGVAPPSLTHYSESSDTLPHYTPRPASAPPHPRSYSRATATIEEFLPTEEERIASLLAFAEEKKYAPDFFGGHKGSAEGMPNDPFKAFRWAKRKMSGEKGHVWRRLSEEQLREWEAEGGAVNEALGEVTKGDMDTSRVA